METLSQLVRSLAVIIIFTSFIEMLLPNASMKQYTRLILGLFVILLVIDPVLTFLNKGSDFSVQGWSAPAQNDQLEKILDNAEELSGRSQETVIREYADKFEQQIAALVRLSPEVENAEVAVELEDGESQFEAGAIRQVLITASVKTPRGTGQGTGDGITDIHRVEIGSDKTAPKEQGTVSPEEQIGRRIQTIVGDFYGLKPGQVVVKLEN